MSPCTSNIILSVAILGQALLHPHSPKLAPGAVMMQSHGFEDPSNSDDEWALILCRGYDPEQAWAEELCRAPRLHTRESNSVCQGVEGSSLCIISTPTQRVEGSNCSPAASSQEPEPSNVEECQGVEGSSCSPAASVQEPEPSNVEESRCSINSPLSLAALEIHNCNMEACLPNIHTRFMVEEVTTSLSQRLGVDRLASEVGIHMQTIMQEIGGIAVYKIGITSDPHYRMTNEKYGYELDGFEMMHLFLVGEPAQCAKLEIALIETHKGRSGCYNELPGGENAPKSPPCYLYVVFTACGDGVGVGVRARKQRALRSAAGGRSGV